MKTRCHSPSSRYNHKDPCYIYDTGLCRFSAFQEINDPMQGSCIFISAVTAAYRLMTMDGPSSNTLKNTVWKWQNIDNTPATSSRVCFNCRPGQWFSSNCRHTLLTCSDPYDIFQGRDEYFPVAWLTVFSTINDGVYDFIQQFISYY
jgi:hypothetical protein